MQAILFALMSMMLFFTSTFAAVVGGPDMIDGLPIGVMGFEGTFEGLEGVTITANGTLNEIIAQAQLDHPDWKPNFLRQPGPPTDATLTPRANAVQLEQRKKLQVYCWPFPKRPDLQRADSYWVDRVIDYLVAVKGIATAAPRECVKLACLGDATAYLCNDAIGLVRRVSTQALATYVGDIRIMCLSGWNGKTGLVCGKETDSERFYVIVMKQVGGC